MLARTLSIHILSFIIINLICGSTAFAAANSANNLLLDGVKYDDMSMVEEAIAKGADVNFVTNSMSEERVIEEAVKNRNTKILEYLISRGAKVDYQNSTHRSIFNNTPLAIAASHKNVDAVRILVRAGAKAKTGTKDANKKNFSIISNGGFGHKDSVEIVKLLLEAGAPVNLVGNYNANTALGYAVEANDLPAVKVLLANGANPNLSATLLDQTPIYYIHCEALDMAKVLIQSGSSLSARNSVGKTPLLAYVGKCGQDNDVKNKMAILNLFIASGANVNAKDQWGNTALHYLAPLQFREKSIELLLKAGADPTIKNKQGKTPKETIIAAGREKNIVLLDSFSKKMPTPKAEPKTNPSIGLNQIIEDFKQAPSSYFLTGKISFEEFIARADAIVKHKDIVDEKILVSAYGTLANAYAQSNNMKKAVDNSALAAKLDSNYLNSFVLIKNDVYTENYTAAVEKLTDRAMTEKAPATRAALGNLAGALAGSACSPEIKKQIADCLINDGYGSIKNIKTLGTIFVNEKYAYVKNNILAGKPIVFHGEITEIVPAANKETVLRFKKDASFTLAASFKSAELPALKQGSEVTFMAVCPKTFEPNKGEVLMMQNAVFLK